MESQIYPRLKPNKPREERKDRDLWALTAVSLGCPKEENDWDSNLLTNLPRISYSHLLPTAMWHAGKGWEVKEIKAPETKRNRKKTRNLMDK